MSRSAGSARIVADEKPAILVQCAAQLHDILSVRGLETEAFRARLDDGRALATAAFVTSSWFSSLRSSTSTFWLSSSIRCNNSADVGSASAAANGMAAARAAMVAGQRPGDDFICTPHLLMFGSCKISSAELRSQSRRGDKTVCSATVRRTPCAHKQRAFYLAAVDPVEDSAFGKMQSPAPSASRRNPRSWPSVSSESARRSVQR